MNYKGYYNAKTGLWSAVVNCCGKVVKVTAETIDELLILIKKLLNKENSI